LTILLFKVFLYSFSFNVASSTIFSSHQNFSLKIISIFSYLCYSHVSFFEDCTKCLQNSIGFDPSFLNYFFQSLCLLLRDLILLLWSQENVRSLLLFLFIFSLLIVFLIFGILLFKTRMVRVKQIVFSTHMFNVFEVCFELL